MRVVFLLVAACIAVAYGKVTPDYFPTCRRSDPEIEKCVLNAVEALRPRVKEGIPSLNIPALDPFYLPTLKVDRTADNLRLKAVLKNIKAVGAMNVKIEKLKIKLNDKYGADMKLTLPKIAVTGDYDVRGSRILAVDINGKGHMKSVFTGITVVAKGVASPLTKDGVEYLQLDKLTVRTRINGGHINVNDSERPAAAQSAAFFFNNNPKVILDIMNPLVEETAATIAKTYINKVLNTIPINELLED